MNRRLLHLTFSATRPRRGFTLVEMLIALLVLSVGLIGMAALHGQGLSASRTAVYRTLAINMSGDLADRIRANRVAQEAYVAGPTDMGTDNACDTAACTPDQMAAHDLFMWKERLSETLPNGQGEVAHAINPPVQEYTITVTWDEVGDADGLEHTIELRVPDI